LIVNPLVASLHTFYDLSGNPGPHSGEIFIENYIHSYARDPILLIGESDVLLVHFKLRLAVVLMLDHRSARL
jgi:hypothetical protein